MRIPGISQQILRNMKAREKFVPLPELRCPFCEKVLDIDDCIEASGFRFCSEGCEKAHGYAYDLWVRSRPVL